MASIVRRKDKFCVVYRAENEQGETKQKWETFATEKEAKKRVKEIEYLKSVGELHITNCKTVKELLDEYIETYGKRKWALSTYSGNVALINNYIRPMIGDVKLEDINTRYIDKFYRQLEKTKAVENSAMGKRISKNQYVSSSTIRDIHKLLKSLFTQAVKWELMAKNPVLSANPPKYEMQERESWDAETLKRALDLCEDERLYLAMVLSFGCTLRIGEILGLTWDCVEIGEEAVRKGTCYLQINKELMRVDKEAIQELNSKDILFQFPGTSEQNKTVVILKLPKTKSSIRKVYIPRSVAKMLSDWKKEQDEVKNFMGDEYQNYNLVMACSFGTPLLPDKLRTSLKKLIKKHDLPPVVFHSIRHSSVTYKLQVTSGDIKAVQGDSGHAQAKMVTDVYAHIQDDQRKQTAELVERTFFADDEKEKENTIAVPDGVDKEFLQKLMENPEMLNMMSMMFANMKGK